MRHNLVGTLFGANWRFCMYAALARSNERPIFVA
jgi:hypothetical protein